MDENNGLEKEEGQLLKSRIRTKMYGKEGRNSKYINHHVYKCVLCSYYSILSAGSGYPATDGCRISGKRPDPAGYPAQT